MDGRPHDRRIRVIVLRMPEREIPTYPFTVRSVASTWTPSAQRHAVRTGRLDRLQLGVLSRRSPIDQPRYLHLRHENLRRAMAALRACDRAALSHASAVIAADLPVVGAAVNQSCLTVQSGTALRALAKVHLHRAGIDDVIDHDGFRMTPVARSVVDLAREHGVASGLAAADEALHRNLVDPGALADVVERQRRWPGVRRARFMVEFADGLAESPLESVSRLRMAQLGLAPPTLQRLICDEHGDVVTRCDFYWDDYGVVGESDGAMKWENDPSNRDERDARTYELEALGLIVIRWGWSDLRDFAAAARRLRLAFERGARPGSTQRRWLVRAARPHLASGIVAPWP